MEHIYKKFFAIMDLRLSTPQRYVGNNILIPCFSFCGSSQIVSLDFFRCLHIFAVRRYIISAHSMNRHEPNITPHTTTVPFPCLLSVAIDCPCSSREQKPDYISETNIEYYGPTPEQPESGKTKSAAVAAAAAELTTHCLTPRPAHGTERPPIAPATTIEAITVDAADAVNAPSIAMPPSPLQLALVSNCPISRIILDVIVVKALRVRKNRLLRRHHTQVPSLAIGNDKVTGLRVSKHPTWSLWTMAWHSTVIVPMPSFYTRRPSLQWW